MLSDVDMLHHQSALTLPRLQDILAHVCCGNRHVVVMIHFCAQPSLDSRDAVYARVDNSGCLLFCSNRHRRLPGHDLGQLPDCEAGNCAELLPKVQHQAHKQEA
jgi:hypothetical protein